MLAWEACRNVRDLGRYATPNGLTQRGALVRADSLSRLTRVGQRRVVASGIRTIIDIRFPGEVAREPDPVWEDVTGTPVYLNIPVNAGRDPALDDSVSAAFGRAADRLEANRFELDVNPAGYARIVAAVAGAAPGGVVVHCQNGQGRTGIAIALMLSLVGVGDEDIAADFSLSGPSLDELYAQWLASQRDVNAVEAEAFRRQASAAPEAMLDTLAYLRERYGGAEPYLLSAGLTRGDVDRLQRRLVEGSHH